ncbi:hypothetical protein [Sphingomonas morindae]|uniref:DUF4148 domain-containing protein n=1 Tax=Sphingomonas morindae TaxID=1541170 RepID=A0ABY4X5L6_9SPHN|nr:hypothetical protein [Sphingomonas morindae]USI72171.1 hypothetical protein LHA26_12780 [Sphingomonas morindae]
MMRSILAFAMAASVATTLPVAAVEAAPWRPLAARQAQIDRRIDQGVRTGALTRAEAGQLRARFVRLTRLERDYRRSGGLSPRERADLDRRYDALSAAVAAQAHDRHRR